MTIGPEGVTITGTHAKGFALASIVIGPASIKFKVGELGLENSITIDATGITLSSLGNLDMSGKLSAKLSSVGSTTVEGNLSAALKSTVNATVEGSAMTTVKGGVLMLN